MEKVFLNVKESDITSRFLDYDFYFSSTARKERFERKVFDYVINETFKFENKYNVKVHKQTFQQMFSFILYTKCEKRGFKIVRKDINGNNSLIYDELPKYAIYGFKDEERK